MELGAALAGGFSVPGLFLAYAYTRAFQPLLFGVVLVVGVLVGLELPLLLRLLERRIEFKELVARALSVDYAGALVGSLAFSFLLVPYLGLDSCFAVCGLLNGITGLVATWIVPAATDDEARALRRARGRGAVVLVLLLGGLAGAGNGSRRSRTRFITRARSCSRTSPSTSTSW